MVLLIEKHMLRLEPDKKILRRWLSRLGEETVIRMLSLQEADMCSKSPVRPSRWEYFLQIRGLLAQIREEDLCLSLKDLAVNGHDLMALGIRGKAIGETLEWLLEQVLDETLENQRQMLLTAAREGFHETNIH